jgi:hopanoid C-2 methylase
MAWPLLREGRVEDLIHVGLVAHHLITFARQAAAGSQNASFYSGKQCARRRPRAGLGLAKTADFS